MAEQAAAAAAGEEQQQPQHEEQQGQQQGRRAASLRRLLWLVGILGVGCLVVVSPRFLQDLDQNDHQRADDRGSEDCRMEDDCSVGRNTSTCHREQCLLAASRIRTMLNAAADPCSDFYEFACGKWSEPNAKIAPSFNTLQKHVNLEIQMLLASEAKKQRGYFTKLGQFYSSCLASRHQKQAEAQMFTLLNQLGGFVARGEAADLTKVAAAVLKLNGAPLFDLYIDSDVNQKSKLAIYLDLPQRTNAFVKLLKYDRSFQLWQKSLLPVHKLKRSRREENEKSKAFNYMKASADEKKLLHMERLVQQFIPSTVPTASRASEVQQMLLFVSMLSKIYPDEKEVVGKLQTGRSSIAAFSISQLQQSFALVNWRQLVQSVFELNVTDDAKVYVLAPNYMHRLVNLSSRFDRSVMHNSLLVMFARDTLQELVNTSSISNWDTYCTRITTSVFTGAVSALYVRQYSQDYLQQLQSRVTDFFDKLKHGLQTRIKASQWLDEASETAALAKLRALNGHFFTWPHFWNETYISNVMDEIEVGDNDFFWNVIRRYRQLRAFNASLDEHLSYEKRWAYPFVVNAFYEQSINSIVIPLAVLTEPYFQQNMPRFIPYGTMGLIFTHEILHAFDLLGIQYDEKGENAPWLSENSKLAFEQRLACVADQYRNAFVKKVHFMGNQINVEFDWNVTMNENMADISGLHIAYEAWRREQLHGGYSDPSLPDVDLNKEQLFFVSAAQTYCSYLTPEDYIMLVELDFHTPFPERVNGIMMNSEEFANAFQCPVNTPMNPEKKCYMW